MRTANRITVKEGDQAIMDYIDAHSDNPKSFTWTATVEHILEKVATARAVLNNQSTG